MTSQGNGADRKGGGANSPQEKSGATLFDLLRQDHDSARVLFDKIERSSKKEVETRQELFKQIEQELLVHMEGEERFLYTALEQHDEAREKVLVSYEQHVVART